ncbi:long polar fimbrial protein LpfD [Chimaeribacter arupi]|uniref:Long polar fimbrial protein LpfD n=2 Tax=Chimaeribacter arupi TaxID=2060066 RepID=A0A2N5EH81_9GAMM|nr:long polar fimbrial protein LpfD [Chimaeribacter arupi]
MQKVKTMKWKTGGTLAALVTGLLLLNGSARAEDGWGACWPKNGPNLFSATIDKPLDPEKNYAGALYPSAFSWNHSATYKLLCDCPTDTSQHRYTYFKAEPNYSLPIGHEEGFYQINENLEFAAYISVGNRGQFRAPFQDIPNSSDNRSGCPETNADWGSGYRGHLDIYIKKPFVGEKIIPLTTLVSVWATKQPGVYKDDLPVTIMQIEGRIEIPMGCEIPAGYSTQIDFGDYNARDFKNRTGNVPVNARAIEKKLDFKCNNISEHSTIYLKLEATPNPNNPMAIDMGNPDIGAVILRKESNMPIRPGTNDNVELTTTSTDGINRYSSVTLRAYPISTTGKIPQSGEFEGIATLSLDVE